MIELHEPQIKQDMEKFRNDVNFYGKRKNML